MGLVTSPGQAVVTVQLAGLALLWPEPNAAGVIGALSTFPQVAQSAF